jgi:hypothetical protein|tara:strand:+ start:846 stop:1121 length:276 start_codon:yes stop_codon:yes gene_type:complete
MIDEIIEMQKEEDLVYNSMFWSYMLLTKQTTFKKVLETDEEFGLIFDPANLSKSNPEELIDVLIEYFVELEEYEKCADLVSAKKLYKKKKK